MWHDCCAAGGAKRAFGVVGEGREAAQDAQLLEEELLGELRGAAQRAAQLYRSMAALTVDEGDDTSEDEDAEEVRAARFLCLMGRRHSAP